MRQRDERFRMRDRDRPVVAGDVPVKLVVILESADRVAYRVVDVHNARGILCSGDKDLQIAEVAGLARLIFKFFAVLVGYALHVDK